MRRLLVTLAVLAALLVAADRITVRYVDKAVAERMQEDGALSTRPEVSVKGFPFLTQAIRGRYDEVDVHIRDITRNGVTVSRLDVTVQGVQLPLKEVGRTQDVPVLGLDATAVLTYYELAHESGLAGISVRPVGPDLVEVRGTIAGVSATAQSSISLRGDRVIVRAQSLSALGATSSLLKGKLDFSVKVPALPYGLRLTGAHGGSDGIVLTATSGPTVLTPQ